MNEASKDKMRERLGNIDRIRELLFGELMQEYQQRFEKCERRLERVESEFTKFRSEVGDRCEHLQSELSTEIRSAVDSLEKRLKYINITTQNETSKLERELNSLSERNSGSIESLHKDIEVKTNAVRDELSQTRQTLQDDIRVMQERVFAELEQKFINLQDGKIARAELAEFLFELCFKVKGAEMVPELKEAEETLAKAELLLPE